jgi:DNA-directed RNA polymerase subunit RPC12/RpoP
MLPVRRRGALADMDEHAEERLAALESVWYEIIEAVNAGRTTGLVCPECNSPEGLQVEERQGRTVVACPNCKRVVEVGIATA